MPSILNIAHMCSHLQNASKARLGLTSIPSTKYSLSLALALHRSGFFSTVWRGGPHPPTPAEMVEKAPEPVHHGNAATRRLWLGLKYWEGKPVLSNAKMISRPTRLMSVEVDHLERLTRGLPAKLDGGVVQGLGLGECMFVSTRRGVMEAREALAKELGGTLLCRVS